MIKRFFKYLTGFLILCFIQFCCCQIVNRTSIILPAPILGIIVFALLLYFKIIKKEWIEDICNLLLKYMPLFFVPLFVGIVAYYGIIEKNLLSILINLLITVTLTIVITGIFVEYVIKLVRLHKMRKYSDD